MRTVIAGASLLLLLFSIINSNTSRGKSNKGIKPLLAKGDQLLTEKKLRSSLRHYKAALKAITGNKWSIYELKSNFSTNGWFILNQINRIHKLANNDFNLKAWSDIIGEINSAVIYPTPSLICTIALLLNHLSNNINYEFH